MGNLNCCTQQPGQQIDAGIMGEQTQINPDHQKKVRAQMQESPEDAQLQVAEKKGQQTEFPDVSFTKNIQNRIINFQPSLIACLKETNIVLEHLVQMFDPSEQIITVKELLFSLRNNLKNLDLYWIGRYEVQNKKETAEFMNQLDNTLIKLRKLFQDNETQAAAAQLGEGQTVYTMIKEQLNKETTVQLIDEQYIPALRTADQQFREYQPVRDVFENNKDTMQIENIKEELNSSLPGYIRAHFKSVKGFAIWSELFGANIDISKVEFAAQYAKKCNMDQSTIEFMCLQIDNACETISFFEFVHFIKSNDQFFVADGSIDKSKENEIKEILEKGKKPEEPKITEEIHTYLNGARYEGKSEEGKRQGQGILSFHEYTYEGLFENNLPNGQGKETKFGVVYEGNFKDGLFSGEGTLTFPDGTNYSGSFANNKYEGKGDLHEYNGTTLSGQWKDGRLVSGDITYLTGHSYTGEILNSRFRHGKGKLMNEDKNVVFDGEFAYDEPSNGTLYKGKDILFKGTLNESAVTQGTYYYSQGAEYTGDINMALHQRTQQGTLKWHKIQELTGTWARDAPVIATNYFDVSNKTSRYEGQWANFNRHGKGQFYYNSGAVYDGDIVNNLRAGKGSYTFKNGNKYEGDWANNDFNGEGLFTFANGDVYTGQFANGLFHGNGRYVYKNKNVYEGQWAEDSWNGQGKYMNDKGEILKQGTWKNDKLVAPENPEENK